MSPLHLHPFSLLGMAWGSSVALRAGGYFQRPLPTAAANWIRSHLIPAVAPRSGLVPCARGAALPRTRGAPSGGEAGRAIHVQRCPRHRTGGKVGSCAGSGLSPAGSPIHLHNARTKAAVLSPRASSTAAGSSISASAPRSPPRPFSQGHKEGEAGCLR